MDGQPILNDTIVRDPQNNNDFLKVGYSDLISEPSAIHSPKCAHQFTKIIYDYTILGTYWVLTIVFGGLLSFVYGLMYGGMSFLMVWMATPLTRICLVPFGLFARVWHFMVMCFYDPVYESCGKIFSNVNININHATIQNV